MKIALTADWLPVFAGAEHVIAEFHSLWPEAPIFTSVANRGNLGPLNNATINVSQLQKWYRLLGKRHRVLLPWMPQALERFNLSGYDVILSSSHAIGKGIIPPSTAKHICYCHTPMRYAWEMEEEYFIDSRIPHIFWKPLKKKLKELRRWDMTTAKHVDMFIANSTSVKDRIKQAYNRESIVIHPPVSDRFFLNHIPIPKPQSPNPYLAVSRMVPYKRLDLLIECANTFKIPLHIVGTGPAGPGRTFVWFNPKGANL